MRSTRFIAVDCGASRVSCALASAERNGRPVVRQEASEALADDWTTETEWLGQTAEALQRLASRAGFRGKAQLTLPGHVTLAKQVTTPAIATANRERILRFEAAQNIPHPLDEVVWDSLMTAEEQKELRLVLIAAKRRIVTELCGAAERAGLRVTRVLPAWLALVRGHQIIRGAHGGSVLLADIGARSTQLVWCDGDRIAVRILALGGRSVTLAIAGELQISAPAAEDLKRAVNSGASNLPPDSPLRATVRRAGEAFGERLQREIVRSVLSWPRRTALTPPTMLRLSGGGARVVTLAPQLSERLQLPVECDPAPSEPDLAGASRIPNAYMIGLAATAEQSGVNLLPESVRADRILRARQSCWLAAAVLLVVALLPAIGIAERRAAVEGDRAAEIERQLRPLRELARRNADAITQLADLGQREIGRRKELAARSQWQRFLGDLQERLATAGDVWLETLAVDRAGEPVGGAGTGHGQREGNAGLRFKISGKLLDPEDAPAGEARAQQRLRRLFASLEQSPFVAGIEEERFESGGKGLLRFEASLVAAAEQPW